MPWDTKNRSAFANSICQFWKTGVQALLRCPHVSAKEQPRKKPCPHRASLLNVVPNKNNEGNHTDSPRTNKAAYFDTISFETPVDLKRKGAWFALTASLAHQWWYKENTGHGNATHQLVPAVLPPVVPMSVLSTIMTSNTPCMTWNSHMWQSAKFKLDQHL